MKSAVSCVVREIRQCRLTIEHRRASLGDGEALHGKLGAELADGRTLRVQANSAVGLLGAHFKKTAPFELIRSGRLHADTETRPALLPSSVSKNQFNKGSSGFLCGTSNPRRVGNKQQR
jgi:hypothetical protein